MMIAGGIIGAPLTDVIFLAAGASSSSPFNNLTRSDWPFGDVHPSRQIIVLVRGRNANSVNDQNFTTAVTVGGVSATRKYTPPGNQVNVSHWTAWITPRMDEGGPTGTTGTIVASRSVGNGFNFAGMIAFAAYNLKSSDPIDAQTANGDPAGVAINLVGNGILTAMAHVTANSAFTWTGANEVADQAAGINNAERISGALISRTSGATGYVVEADTSASCSMIAVSWR